VAGDGVRALGFLEAVLRGADVTRRCLHAVFFAHRQSVASCLPA
jgi:hypothetical protein